MTINYNGINKNSEQFHENKSDNFLKTPSSLLFLAQPFELKTFINVLAIFLQTLLNLFNAFILPYFYYPLIFIILTIIFVNYGYFITFDEEFIIAICFFVVVTTLYNLAAIQLYKLSDNHRRYIWAYLLFTLNRLEFVLLGFIQSNIIILLQKIAALEEFLLLSRNFLFFVSKFNKVFYRNFYKLWAHYHLYNLILLEISNCRLFYKFITLNVFYRLKITSEYLTNGDHKAIIQSNLTKNII